MKHRLTQLLAALALGAAVSLPALASKDVVIAIDQNFTTMDPYDANDTLSPAVAKSFYQGLYGFDRSMKIVPLLAESHVVSKDGLVYTLKLKRGVKFHDGSDFNAEAVKVTFDRVTNPENKLKRYNLYKNIAKTEVVDPYTVRFTLKESFSPFINTLAHPTGVIISSVALARLGKGIAQSPVGTGPFRFVEWKQGDFVRVEKFAGYWRKGYPKVDTLTWRPVADNNTRSAILQTGEAHFIYSVPYEQAEVLKSKPGIELTASPSIIHRFMSMNTQQKPFDNVKVREAINYAINKEALIKVAFSGYAIPADGVLPRGMEHALKLGPWPYDPAKARELLKEAGYPNGFESTLWAAVNNTTWVKAIQFLQQQLGQVGIKVQVQALETGQRVEKVESAKDAASAPVRMYYMGWSSSTGEADWAMRPILASESFPPRMYNTAYYKNDAVDADIAKALNTTSADEKDKLYADAQRRIWKDAPWAFLVTEQLLSARNKKLTGMYVMPDGSFDFNEIELK